VVVGSALVIAALVLGLLIGQWTDDDDPAAPSGSPTVATAPSGEYSNLLLKQVEALAAARLAGLERLRDAPTPGKQAAAGRALAVVYSRSGERVANLSTPAGGLDAQRRIVVALGSVADAYKRLARAAAERNRGIYEAGRRMVRRAEVAVRQEFNSALQADSS
jgi:hypothetical protein